MIFEYVPLIAFGTVYFFKGMIMATIALIITSIIVVPILWKKNGKVPLTHIFTAVLVVGLGGITLISGDTSFIKMKPTIVSALFACILFGSLLSKRNLVKKILGNTFKLSDKNWRILTFRIGVYFILTAIANEIVWRNYDEETWVKFKLFGLTGTYILFLLLNINFFKKNAKMNN